MALGKKTGGRQKGTKNKRSERLERAIGEIREAQQLAPGLMPLDFLLQVVRDTSQEMSVRVTAATQAAKYCHPTIASVAVEHTNVPATELTTDALARGLAECQALLGVGGGVAKPTEH